jgi:8-oxo-dGTP pyrophosphatase MutT (NUDIX family)
MSSTDGSSTDRSSIDSRAAIAANLASFQRAALPLDGRRPASVAVCLVLQPDSGACCLLITRRAPTLRSHAGQWALPGGRRDAGEFATEAALRELHEETGVRVAPSDVLGVLDDYATRSGYLITPVVVWGGQVSGEMRGPATEVAQIYVIPVADFDVEPRQLSIPESPNPVIQLPILDRLLHAPTAAVIYQFCQVGLHGRATRVAHFEQPVFAWR